MAAELGLFNELLQEAKESFILGNYKVAEPILTQMILNNTRNPEVFQMLATIYYDKGLFNKAIKTFKRALEIDPTYTDASVGLSIILNDLGRYEEGKTIFEEAKALLDKRKNQPDPFVDEKIASKHEELADLYFQYQRYNEALEQLFKAQKLSHRRAEIGLRIAECHIKLAQFERVIKDLQSLTKEYPAFIAAKMKLAQVYYNLNQIAEATDLWEAVLARDPSHTEAKKCLKMVHASGLGHLEA